jgi:hypothetical protein
MLRWYTLGMKMYSFFGTFCIILGANILSFHSVLINIENGFFTQNFQHNFCYLSYDSVFSTSFYVFTHLCLFEWTTSSRCFLWNHMSGIFHIKLKWDIEFICNIWLSTSSNLVIIWIVFEVYFHFGVCCDNYRFFTTVFSNCLISISKWDFFWQFYFLGFELFYFKYHLQKNLFHIYLVEV